MARTDPIGKALAGRTTPAERIRVLLTICRLLKEAGYRCPQRGDHGAWVPWATWLRHRQVGQRRGHTE